MQHLLHNNMIQQPVLPILAQHRIRPPRAHRLPTSSRFTPALLRLQPRRRKALNPQTTFIAKLSQLLPRIPIFPLLPSQPVPRLTKLLTFISSGNSVLFSLYIKPRSLVRPLRLPLLVPRLSIRLNRLLLTFTKLLQRLTILTHGMVLPHLTLGSFVRPLRLLLLPPGLLS